MDDIPSPIGGWTPPPPARASRRAPSPDPAREPSVLSGGIAVRSDPAESAGRRGTAPGEVRYWGGPEVEEPTGSAAVAAGRPGTAPGEARFWDGPEVEDPTGSAAVAAAAGGLATWLPDGRWSTPAALAPPDVDAWRIAARGGSGSPPPDIDGWATEAGDARAPRGGSGREPGDAPDDEAALVRRRQRVRAVRVLARLAGWPRRVAAVTFALTAVLLMMRPDAPAPPTIAAQASVPVVVAARDLAAGTTLTRAHLRTTGLPSGAVPAGAARDLPSAVGRVVAGPVRRGEPLTDARLLGPGLTAGLDATEATAVPVRLADPESGALVRPGDRVDVLGTAVEPDGGSRGDAVTFATSVRVLAVVRGDEAADGVLLVVATAPAVARRLAGAAAGHRLTVAVRPP